MARHHSPENLGNTVMSDREQQRSTQDQMDAVKGSLAYSCQSPFLEWKPRYRSQNPL